MDSRLKLLLSPFAVLGILSYVAVHFFRYYQISIPNLLNNYLTDFFCLPIILVICTIVMRTIKNDLTFRPSFEMVLSITFLFSILFELVLPRVSKEFTADKFDIAAYFLGLIPFYLFIYKRQPFDK